MLNVEGGNSPVAARRSSKGDLAAWQIAAGEHVFVGRCIRCVVNGLAVGVVCAQGKTMSRTAYHTYVSGMAYAVGRCIIQSEHV